MKSCVAGMCLVEGSLTQLIIFFVLREEAAASTLPGKIHLDL